MYLIIMRAMLTLYMYISNERNNIHVHRLLRDDKDQGLIQDVIWKKTYYSLFIIYTTCISSIDIRQQQFTTQ